MINTWTVEGRAVTPSTIKKAGKNYLESFRMVSNWSRKVDGGWDTKSMFFNVQRWLTAEGGGANIQKGNKLVVSGQLVNDEWTDKQGARHDKPLLLASSITKVGGGEEQGQAYSQPVDGDGVPEPVPQQVQVEQKVQFNNETMEGFKDDVIPF